MGDSLGDSFGRVNDIRNNQSTAGLMNFGRGGGGRGGDVGGRNYHMEQENYDDHHFQSQAALYMNNHGNRHKVNDSYFKDGFEF
jgi:hypothetical protein